VTDKCFKAFVWFVPEIRRGIRCMVWPSRDDNCGRNEMISADWEGPDHITFRGSRLTGFPRPKVVSLPRMYILAGRYRGLAFIRQKWNGITSLHRVLKLFHTNSWAMWRTVCPEQCLQKLLLVKVSASIPHYVTFFNTSRGGPKKWGWILKR